MYRNPPTSLSFPAPPRAVGLRRPASRRRPPPPPPQFPPRSTPMKRPLAPARTDPRSTNESFKKEALEALLKHHFGYSEFRGKQFDAIEAVLSGRDCFCLMPTGGGKSMCFQIPALAKPGVVLVVSPLIALMENQVMALKQKGIPAEFLSSTQTAGTREKIHEDLNSGKPSVRLLYVTPELIATFGFMTKITKLYHRGLLSLIAIDEAHCISTWGHDFRPSYRKLSSLRSRLPDVPILALTATAVPKVQMDVMKSLCLQDPLILRASFNRPNIFYEVRYKDLLQDAYTDLADVLKSCGNVCSIVYCLERSACDDLANHLLKEGISSAAYHAGLNNKLRSTVLDDWLSAKIQVVVATVAFGMGIDRKDVRVVFHFNMPKSMEAFYQESGRAGRDQLPSKSVLYYGIDDCKKMEFILKDSSRKKSESSSSSVGELKKSLADFNQMVEYCENSGCRRKKILESFGEVVSASFCHKSCDACKNPNLVTANLEEVKRIPSKKYGLPPIFAKSSSDATFVGGDSEFWNRDDEASSPDEEISDSDDEAEDMCNLVKSKMPTKSRLNEKYEALKRAEELYYQKEDQRKQSSSVVEKNAVTETLREVGQKRLSSALKQAHERLGVSPPNSESSVKFLEADCFRKYGKVGKTFYNSQLAATVRWLSSASHQQLQDRLSADPAPGTSHSLPDVIASPPRDPHEENTTLSETTQGNVRIEDPCVPVQMATTMEKLVLPPIPSFSEFANKGRSQHSSGGGQKRRTDSDGRGRMQPEKRMKQ